MEMYVALHGVRRDFQETDVLRWDGMDDFLFHFLFLVMVCPATTLPHSPTILFLFLLL